MDTPTSRHGMSFAQAEGVVPLPRALQPKELNTTLRNLLWAVVYENIAESTGRRDDLEEVWLSVLRRVHIVHFERPADEFQPYGTPWICEIKEVMYNGDYIAVYGLIQFLCRTLKSYKDYSFCSGINDVLKFAGAGYRLIEYDTLFPVANEQQLQAVVEAINLLSKEEFFGARSHLTSASDAFNEGRYAQSVRESIHAVESVARTLDPNSSTLAPALASIERKGYIHPALKSGFEKIYGFTSNEQGIRHCLLEKSRPDVDDVDALFMIGACASFVSYLIGKSK